MKTTLHHRQVIVANIMTSSNTSTRGLFHTGSAQRSHFKSNATSSSLTCDRKQRMLLMNSGADTQREPFESIRPGWTILLALVLTITYLPLKTNCQTSISPDDLSATTPVITTSTAADYTSTKFASEWVDEGPTGASVNNTSAKLKPVNFTLVEQIFETVLGEDEVVKRWRNMDAQLQDGMKSILKMVFPMIVSISQDAKVSGDCSGGILKWILSLRNLRSWAVKMLDASGKPSSGIFEGSLTMFGNYRQCLSIRAPDEDEIEITDQFEEYFRGQFCVLHLKPWMPIKPPFYNMNSSIEPLLRQNYKYYEKTLYDELAELAIAFNFMDIRMDLCVPSTCTVADIQRVAELLSKKVEMRAKVMRCDIASRDTNPFQYLDSISCYWLIVPLCVALISLLATLVTIALPLSKNSLNFGEKSRKILKSLSIVEVLKDRLLAPRQSAGFINGDIADQERAWDNPTSMTIYDLKPLPLYGLRSLFVFWFIIVQMTVELNYQYLRESITLRNMIISYWPFQIIVNSVLLFDSLILITAFTYSYTCLESTLKDLIVYIIDKYLRIILAIITLIALTIVTPLLAIESPVWRNFVEEQSAVCKSNGYLNLFFLQNFISYDKICLPHTWLFCVELQLIILAVPLMILFKKSFLGTEDSVIISLNAMEEEERKYGRSISLLKVSLTQLIKTKAGISSAFLLICGVLINFLVVYTNQLPPSWFYTFPDVAQKNYYFGLYLTKTWTHLGVFMVGLVGGHLCRTTSKLRLLKAHQPVTECELQAQPSPTSTKSMGGRSASRRIHSSTSTIMTNELDGQQSDGNSTGENQSKKNRTFSESIMSRFYQMAALICMLAIIFSTYIWSTQQGPSTLVAALYDALSRLIWSMALVDLIIKLCLPNKETNRYSLATKILSHPVCISLGRLSFLVYLLAPYINNFVLAVQEQSLFPSLFIIFHVIVGNTVITYILAFIIAIVIEQPVRRLFSRFVSGRRFHKQRGSIPIFVASINK